MQHVRMPLPFVKMSGTGNDFILIDNRNGLVPEEKMSEFAKRVCRRKFSVGADGLILLEQSERADFKWHFFNGDGSVAEMCGNGARCAARFAYLEGIAPARMRFETLAGLIEANVTDALVSILMTIPKDIRLYRKLPVDGRELTVHSLDTGVPHAVLFYGEGETPDIRRLGSLIRHHEQFLPAGTNVNFVCRKGENCYQVRTYERGVEDETFACGTGAAASALVASLLGEAHSPVDIITSGGDRLTILFDLNNPAGPDNVYLKGPAHVIYRGELSPEALL